MYKQQFTLNIISEMQKERDRLTERERKKKRFLHTHTPYRKM